MKRCCSFFLCVLLLMTMVLTTSCNSQSFTQVSRNGFALDTFISISLYDAADGVDGEAVLDVCFSEIKRLESLLSVTIDDSDIAKINASDGKPVEVSRETADLLQTCLLYAELSAGAFDPTLREVTALWDFSADSPRLPEQTALDKAVETVGYQHLTVQGTTVTLEKGGIDVGGIAKGYIADRVAELLKEHGVTSALVDLGGNIVVCGNKENKDWRVGIKDPLNTDDICAVVTGRDMSVVTSGIYERGFTLDGVRYHHLLSPQTGMPIQNGLAAVSIVCKSSVRADALSTACFVLGEEKAREMIRSMDDVEAMFVYQDGTIRTTEGLSYTLA